MEFVLWLAGVMVTLVACKFIFQIFRRIGSKENLNAAIDRINDGINSGVETVANKFRERRRQKEEEKPVVTIH